MFNKETNNSYYYIWNIFNLLFLDLYKEKNMHQNYLQGIWILFEVDLKLLFQLQLYILLLQKNYGGKFSAEKVELIISKHP